MTTKFIKIEVEIDEKECNPVIAYEFQVTNEKEFTVIEHWHMKEEMWASGRSIKIPAWVWEQAGPWIMEHIK